MSWQRGLASLLSVALALTCAGSSLAAGGSGIVIAPLPGSPVTYTWSLTSARVPGCPARLSRVLVMPSAWNLRPGVPRGACIPSSTQSGTTTGQITWRSDPSGLTMSAAIASTQRVHPLTPVAAYPELVYGWSPFFGIASRQAATLRFPIALDALVRRQRPDPVLSTDYVLCGSCLNRGPIDLAYDLWISRGRSPVWCGHGAAPAPGCVPTPSNVIEVMIWLAHSRTFAPAGRPRPAWFTAGAWLDGRKSLMAFRMYACTSCSHDIVSFVLAGGPSGKLPRGLLHGLISLPLDAFLRQAWLRTGRRAGYLDGIELGSEIAPAHDGDPTRFWFTLRRYWLSSGAPAPSS